MATTLDPRPTALPIAEGRAGSTVRLHPLLCGLCSAPPGFVARVGTGPIDRLRTLGFGVPKDQWSRIPIVAFLVEHPSLGPMLIDTGLHHSVAVDGRGNLSWTGPLVLRDLEMDAGQAVPAQLRDRGIYPGSVSFVLMTHMHTDHASGITEFPDATFITSTAEWAACTAGGAFFNGYIRKQFDHALMFRLIDFEAPDVGSFATFGRGVDLFGDGSVHAVFTPGHTAGHVSYVLRLEGREALIAGDAIYAIRTLEESAIPWRTHDEHNFRRSLREIQLYARETPGALVVPGHDLQHWQTLDAVY